MSKAKPYVKSYTADDLNQSFEKGEAAAYQGLCTELFDKYEIRSFNACRDQIVASLDKAEVSGCANTLKFLGYSEILVRAVEKSTSLDHVKSLISLYNAAHAKGVQDGKAGVTIDTGAEQRAVNFQLNFPVTPPHGVAINQDELDLIKHGQWIGAIKNLRSRTGLPLREAKDIVDAYKAAITVKS